jgi:hypothetical protein
MQNFASTAVTKYWNGSDMSGNLAVNDTVGNACAPEPQAVGGCNRDRWPVHV